MAKNSADKVGNSYLIMGCMFAGLVLLLGLGLGVYFWFNLQLQPGFECMFRCTNDFNYQSVRRAMYVSFIGAPVLSGLVFWLFFRVHRKYNKPKALYLP